MSTDQQQPEGRFEPAVPDIPLVDDNAYSTGLPSSGGGDQSVGSLVRDATTHLSTLVRAEVELAKTEVTAEIKKGLLGSVFFVVALAVVLFSLFFFFITLAEGLADLTVLARSACYAIVFGFMILLAAIAALIGFLVVRKLRAPERTISSAKDTVAALKQRGGEQADQQGSPQQAQQPQRS